MQGPDFVKDGTIGTTTSYYLSASSSGQWLFVDLGRNYLIEEVVVHRPVSLFETYKGFSVYPLEVYIPWTPIQTSAQTETAKFSPVSERICGTSIAAMLGSYHVFNCNLLEGQQVWRVSAFF